MNDVSSEQSRNQFVAILLLLQQQCCWFIESDASVFFLFIQNTFFFHGTPWLYCVAFTASIRQRPR